jgi:lipid A disaccharide synthetase
MPGSRSYEVENLVPFYFAVALQIARERPGVPIAFGLSPFTPYDQVRAAIEGGGHPRIFGARGRLEFIDERPMLVSQDGSVRIPILHHALASAARARLVATIPGTKCIELAALGKPVVTITPFNAPEAVTVNGPLTYLDRIPLIGIPLKRSVALAVAKRFVYHTQPNMDANAALIDEVHSTVTPGRIARRLLSRYDDRAWLEETGTRLAALYRDHVGAADRMAASLLQLAG